VYSKEIKSKNSSKQQCHQKCLHIGPHAYKIAETGGKQVVFTYFLPFRQQYIFKVYAEELTSKNLKKDSTEHLEGVSGQPGGKTGV
jgi:hypothetical protein